LSANIFRNRKVIVFAILMILVCLMLLRSQQSPTAKPNKIDRAKARLLAKSDQPPVEPGIKNQPLSAADRDKIHGAKKAGAAARAEDKKTGKAKDKKTGKAKDKETGKAKDKETGKEKKAANSAPDSSVKHVYVHIPKTGGTKVEGYLGETLDKELSRHRKQVINEVGQGCTKKHIPPAWFTVAEFSPYTNTETFTILRNPYARLISEYKYMCWGPRKTGTMKELLGKTDLGPIEECKRNIDQMNDYFDAVLPKVNIEPEIARLTDCHFIPQTVYVKGVDHVFCTAQQVQDHIIANFPNVDKDEVLTFRDPKMYESTAKQFRPEVLRKINHEYAGDFKLCGWKMLKKKDLTSPN